MKRILWLIVALMLLLTMATGCKTKQQEEGASADTVVGESSADQNGGSSNGPQKVEQNKKPSASDGKEETNSSNPSDTDTENSPSNNTENPPSDNSSNGNKTPTPETNEGGEDSNEKNPSDNENSQKPNPNKKPSNSDEEQASSKWITVCSYNVKVLFYDHINNANGQPMSKFDAICNELKKINADIVGLQELERFSNNSGKDVDQLQKLADALGYPYYYYTKTITSFNGGGEYGHGILSRYPFKSNETFPFYLYYVDSPTESRAFSRSELEVDGKTLVFYNSHLAGPLEEQFNVVTKMMAEDEQKGLPAVFTGDMNISPSHLVEVSNGCTMLNSVEAPQRTSVPDDWMFMEPDNIVVNGNLEYEWNESKKTGVTVNQTTASDHLPLYAKIRLK